MQIRGKLLLNVNTGYKLRNLAKTVTEWSLKFNEYSGLICDAGLLMTAENTIMLQYRSTMM